MSIVHLVDSNHMKKKLSVEIWFIVCAIAQVVILNNNAQAQINESNGLRIPGDWNSWTNTHNMGGDFDLVKTTDGLLRWTTTFQYTGSTGSVNFKIASGPSGGEYSD